MFSHVGKELSAYCHDELAPEDLRRVAEHLIACQRCRAEFEEIKLGVKLAQQLPELSAPDSVWRELEVLLDSQTENGKARSNDDIATRRRWPGVSYRDGRLRFRYLPIAAVLLLALGIGLFSFFRREAGPSWQVASLNGAPRIGSAEIRETGRLGVGQWLETDGSSRAKIDVGDIGQVEIDPNSRVRLLTTRPTEHRLELAHGRLSARIWAPPKLFYVDTPSAVAEDLGCAYTLEVDDHGGGLLRVTLGWVSLQLKDRESMVPAGAACATRPGIGPGTPYFEDASDTFKQALSQFDFERNVTVSPANATPLEVVIGNARARDTLTLWHLLPRVEGVARETVYDRMAALVPPPDGVSREGVLTLNQQMLDSWKDKLELSWGDQSSPTMKTKGVPR